MRVPLGDGWILVHDVPIRAVPVAIVGSPTDAEDQALEEEQRRLEAYFEDPRSRLVHLEGPDGSVLYLPYETAADTLAKLGLVRRRAGRKPGTQGALTRLDIAAAIWRRLPDEVTQELIAEDLDKDLATVKRTLKGVGWKAFRRIVTDSYWWTTAHQ